MELTKIFHSEVVALDTETTGLDWKRNELIGFSAASSLGSGYWDVRHTPEAISELRDALSGFKGLIVMFNASFDCKFLLGAGVYIDPLQVDDAAVRATLIDEHLPQYSLDYLAKTYLGKEKHNDIYHELAANFGGLATRNVQMPRLWQAPPEMVAPYAISDAELTLELWQFQEGEIDEQGLREVAEFERRTFPHVLDQETRGVRVCLETAEVAQARLSEQIGEEKKILSSLVGREFNVNSTPQIRDYYQPKEDGNGGFVLANGTPCKTTTKGNASIDNEVLQSMAETDPVAAKIIEIRSLIRTCDTFLGKHVLGHAYKGRVYPNINQVASENGGTKTGRFSYTAPALQQIPNRNKAVAAIVKPCFLPDEGHTWVDGDLNSFEVRVFASLVAAYNNALVQIYAEDPTVDFHQWVSEIMGVPRDPQPTGGANAKQLNLSMIFNSGNGSIARKLGYPTTPESFIRNGKLVRYHKPCAEAMAVINLYHSRVQGVKKLAERAKHVAETRGYVKTYRGRHLRFKKTWKSKTYKASGVLIQATAAEINKENWAIINEALDGRGRLLLNTHDSYGMSIEEGKENAVWKDVKRAIERDVLRVPLILDYSGSGSNWWEALQG